MYSGFKKKHGFNWLGTMAPNGLFVFFLGPCTGRNNDTILVRDTDYYGKLKGLVHAAVSDDISHGRDGERQYTSYGDSIFSTNDVMAAGYFQVVMQDFMQEANGALNQPRTSVEWGFGLMGQYFPYLNQSRSFRLCVPRPKVIQIIETCAILTNMYTCARGGNQINTYFGLSPPSLETYVSGGVISVSGWQAPPHIPGAPDFFGITDVVDDDDEDLRSSQKKKKRKKKRK